MISIWYRSRHHMVGFVSPMFTQAFVDFNTSLCPTFSLNWLICITNMCSLGGVGEGAGEHGATQLSARLDVHCGRSLYCARSSFPNQMTELLLSLYWRILFPIFTVVVTVTCSQLGTILNLPSWQITVVGMLDTLRHFCSVTQKCWYL